MKLQFLRDVIDIVKMEEIPPSLIFNWDQTGLHLHVVPSSSWTMARKDSKRVEMKGMEDKRQITAVFVAHCAANFFPYNLLILEKLTEVTHLTPSLLTGVLLTLITTGQTKVRC